MQALINLHNELIALYGYQLEISAALGQWNKFLKSLQNRTPNQRIFFGTDDPNTPSAKYQYAQSVAYLIHASEKNGINVNRHRQSVVTLTYAIWEDQYRKRIAYECGLSNKRDIKSDVFQDLNKYRQAILHAGGRLVREPNVIHFFKLGEEVLLTNEHMNELFAILIVELNRIAKTYYRQDPGFSLNKPLNNSHGNQPERKDNHEKGTTNASQGEP
ncbi:MAG: hypothetical protein OXB94_06935 [Nitrospira sp.]|nr:hypothetical protein [Nitrospira sp.]